MNILYPIIIIILLNHSLFSQERILESFDSDAALNNWKVYKADGVDIEVSSEKGYKGKGIRLDYDFTKGTGYGGIQKIIPLELPENYQFTFFLKAESSANNFEIKFLDSTGQNVWWVNNRNFSFPSEWTKIKIKKKHINFAWGPAEDHSIKRIERIEFTIASYLGGKGTVWIDEMNFVELPPEDNSQIIPLASASSESDRNYSVQNITDNNPQTEWKSKNAEDQEIILKLKKRREFGAIIIDWSNSDYAEVFNIYISPDNEQWEKIYSVENAGGNKSYIRLKEEDGSAIKLELKKSSNGKTYGIKDIYIKNTDYSADINRFIINKAKDYPRGYFPRYFYEEATFWTIVGVNSDVQEALINEDGMVEVGRRDFSIEPFLYIDKKLVGWNEVESEQSLEENYLPIPSVIWNYKDLQLKTTAFASGKQNRSALFLIYKLVNNSSSRKEGNLYLAIRPFQVNPYYQWLNITGGATEIYSLEQVNGKISVNDDKFVIPITREYNFGAAAYDEGDIIEYIFEDKIPENRSVKDKSGSAGGCLNYSFDLKPGEERIVYISVPFHTSGISEYENLSEEIVEDLLSQTIKFWKDKINHIKFNLPESGQSIIDTYRSNLAYILINRDGAGIQPGSRSYERSWIRDGSLTSSALLKSGIADEVKEFIKWYAEHQYEDGKVPCVVDSRGPDPVPENDSHGQFIYLVKEYFNFTHDTLLLRSINQNVKLSVSYMNELIAQRTTEEYTKDSLKPYYGILPESISHEGYSAKPMHSYWDDFFGMKGFKDAAEIQKILEEEDTYRSFSRFRDQFKTNLYNSLDLAIKKENIDYIPGCVELGDFDATSTTVAISPCNELHNLPQPYTSNTFDKYYEYFRNRRDNKIEWTGYTPYENRLIGSFIFLGQPERAHDLIDFFLNDRKPHSWNHWAEVVWNNDRHPGFIGDMPHTWVGSDFINAVRSMFVYENEYDSSIVIGAALYQDWIDSPSGMSVENLPTYFGELSYSIKKDKNNYTVKLYGDIKLPSGGIILKNFNGSKLPQKVLINGIEEGDFTSNRIIIKDFPSEVEIVY